MNVFMQARLVGNDRYLFVNTQRANPSIKTYGEAVISALFGCAEKSPRT